ncbi:MAG: isopentenyl phosphate kinase [Halobacteria archaeon]|nr:isopentenyl phosphate kinase [Halobacteria archaeon]
MGDRGSDGHTVLKIGGSVLTDRSSEDTLDEKRFEASLGAVADSEHDSLILVHGAGSYGHPHAERHGLTETEGGIEGVYETHSAVSELNRRVVEELRSRGTEALPVHPLSCGVKTPSDGESAEVKGTGGRTFEMMTRQTETLLDEGFLPVLHGDLVADAGEGASVVSGDTVALELARCLGSVRLGFCTSAGGVLGSDGVLDEVEDVDAVDERGDGIPDVTGGIVAKVEKILSTHDGGHVFGVEDIPDFLDGKDVGTEVNAN